MTRTGMCCAYCVAASATADAAVGGSASSSSSSSRQQLTGGRLERAIALGENAGSSSRRAISWNGGSEVIGGA